MRRRLKAQSAAIIHSLFPLLSPIKKQSTHVEKRRERERKRGGERERAPGTRVCACTGSQVASRQLARPSCSGDRSNARGNGDGDEEHDKRRREVSWLQSCGVVLRFVRARLRIYPRVPRPARSDPRAAELKSYHWVNIASAPALFSKEGLCFQCALNRSCGGELLVLLLLCW